jgi:hypothetical protein
MQDTLAWGRIACIQTNGVQLPNGPSGVQATAERTGESPLGWVYIAYHAHDHWHIKESLLEVGLSSYTAVHRADIHQPSIDAKNTWPNSALYAQAFKMLTCPPFAPFCSDHEHVGREHGAALSGTSVLSMNAGFLNVGWD